DIIDERKDIELLKSDKYNLSSSYIRNVYESLCLRMVRNNLCKRTILSYFLFVVTLCIIWSIHSTSIKSEEDEDFLSSQRSTTYTTITITITTAILRSSTTTRYKKLIQQIYNLDKLNYFYNSSSIKIKRQSTIEHHFSTGTNQLTNDNVSTTIDTLVSQSDETRLKYWLINSKTAGVNLSMVLAQKSQKKYLVYACHANCGGWGDRLRGIMSTFMMSLMLDRDFRIEITHPCNLTRVLKPNFYNWLRPLNVLRRDPITHKSHKLTLKAIMTTDNIKKSYLKNVSKIIQNSTINQIWSEDIIYMSTNKNYFHEMSENLRYRKKFKTYGILTKYDIKLETLFPLFYELLFQPVERVKQQIEQYINMRKNRTLICAQLRKGQNPTLVNDKVLLGRRNITEIIFNFIDNYIKTNDTIIDYKIFVTTDSDAVQKEAKRRYTHHLIHTQGTITHLDRSNTDEAC
ncbi:unnamed protein product, partial [Didymodactylos carnosus]